MAEAVYVLCLLTSATVAFLLLRGFARTRGRILLWSGLGFVGLALNSLALVFDQMVVPQQDLSLLRGGPTLIGMSLMVFGLIWDAE